MTSPLTPQKKYYDVLDGLRGLAALVILVYHYLEIIHWDNYEENVMAHGFLAVDFFFCLSGFVVAFAYDGRIEKIGLKNFFVNRLIRLHPMVIFGTLLGFLFYICDPFVADPLVSGWGRILLALVLSLLLIPAPFLAHRGGGVFPYNTPAWSLFFEYIANVVYALVLVRLKKKWLLVFGLLSAVWLGWCAHRSGWIINGWALERFGDGFARVAFSFTAGMIVYRFGLSWKNPFGIFLPALILLGAFFYPHFNNDWLAEFLIVTVVFPSVIMIGSGAAAKGAVRKFALFIGRLSYPLYLTHIPTVWLFDSYFRKYDPAGFELVAIVAALIALNLLIAWLAMRFYDEPVRRRLTRKWKERAAAQTS